LQAAFSLLQPAAKTAAKKVPAQLDNLRKRCTVTLDRWRRQRHMIVALNSSSPPLPRNVVVTTWKKLPIAPPECNPVNLSTGDIRRRSVLIEMTPIKIIMHPISVHLTVPRPGRTSFSDKMTRTIGTISDDIPNAWTKASAMCEPTNPPRLVT
jgi:hypothetical protein